MSEEVKQEQPEVKKTAQAQGSEAQTSGEKTEKKSSKVEIPKNCGSCKKPIYKIRYYRNMQFFCNKKCWEKFKEAQEKKKKEEGSKQQEQTA
ncbi:MAG: hypothetical protein HY810_00640 [Candidatus Omnitrophica bacterium]|nr:hypothetical protein [Candidatus Omnitrophota bacterium]